MRNQQQHQQQQQPAKPGKIQQLACRKPGCSPRKQTAGMASAEAPIGARPDHVVNSTDVDLDAPVFCFKLLACFQTCQLSEVGFFRIGFVKKGVIVKRWIGQIWLCFDFPSGVMVYACSVHRYRHYCAHTAICVCPCTQKYVLHNMHCIV